MTEVLAKRGLIELKFDVTGMNCAACAGKVETSVRKIAGASEWVSKAKR